MFVQFICIFVFLLIFNGSECEYFCSDDFCEAYRQKNNCPLLSLGCQIQNETHSGEIFPASEPCNCCNICLEFIQEGDFCTIGSMDAAPPLYACGPGLKCTRVDNTDDYVCKKMTDTVCFKEQIEFDRLYSLNLTGSYMQRPNCDGDGNYQPIKCNEGQNCFCINENGDRIFGEAVHSLYTKLTMKCECSRLNDKLSRILDSRYPVITARCLEDGSYDPLQCMGEMCLCVDRNNGFPSTDTFNATEVGFESLPCYNESIHRSWIYLHNCEQHELINDIQKSEADGYTVIFSKEEFCQADGWFLPVQQNETHKFCGDKYGRDLKNYAVLRNEAKGMNCLCARTEYLLSRHAEAERPDCCPNGNFKRVQCRSGNCYCVDAHGLQTKKEVDESEVSTLSCYNRGKLC